MNGKNVSINRLIYQVSSSIHLLLKVSRPTFSGVTAIVPDLHDKSKSHIHRLKYTRVLWQMPPAGWIKCNTDGACRCSDGSASYTFLIRDGVGDLLYAQAHEIQDATNNIAEVKAILEALKYIVHSQLTPCLVETDSLLMERILDEVWEPPCNIVVQVVEIKKLIACCVVEILHVLREGNKLADHLVNLGAEFNYPGYLIW